MESALKLAIQHGSAFSITSYFADNELTPWKGAPHILSILLLVSKDIRKVVLSTCFEAFVLFPSPTFVRVLLNDIAYERIKRAHFRHYILPLYLNQMRARAIAVEKIPMSSNLPQVERIRHLFYDGLKPKGKYILDSYTKLHSDSIISSVASQFYPRKERSFSVVKRSGGKSFEITSFRMYTYAQIFYGIFKRSKFEETECLSKLGTAIKETHAYEVKRFKKCYVCHQNCRNCILIEATKILENGKSTFLNRKRQLAITSLNNVCFLQRVLKNLCKSLGVPISNTRRTSYGLLDFSSLSGLF